MSIQNIDTQNNNSENNNTQNNDEEITLYSPEYDQRNEDISLNNITHELLQTNSWKEQQKLFRIFDNKYISVAMKDANVVTNFSINLTFLGEKPVRRRTISFKYFLFSVISFSLAWLTYYLIQNRIPYFTNLYMYAVVTLLTAVGAIIVVYMVKQAKNSLVFYSEHGQVPIIELFFGLPDKSTFRKFAGELVKCIKLSKTDNYYTDSQTLAAELSEHRRLRDEGIINDNQYENAKARIFTYHSRFDSPLTEDIS